MSEKWTQALAVELCRRIEVIAPKYGCHVALTGGTLYHFGERKDADILFYRIRQVEYIDVLGLMDGLRLIGVEPGRDYGWCHKATFEGRPIDFFFPERDGADCPGYGEPPDFIDAAEPEAVF